MKKRLLNILAAVDLAAIGVWLISYIIAQAGIEAFSTVFLFAYIAAAVIVVVFTAASIVFLIKKKPCSKPLLISTYAVNIIWMIVFIAVITSIE